MATIENSRSVILNSGGSSYLPKFLCDGIQINGTLGTPGEKWVLFEGDGTKRIAEVTIANANTSVILDVGAPKWLDGLFVAGPASGGLWTVLALKR